MDSPPLFLEHEMHPVQGSRRVDKIWGIDIYGERGARACNGELGAALLARGRGRAKLLMELKAFLAFGCPREGANLLHSPYFAN